MCGLTSYLLISAISSSIRASPEPLVTGISPCSALETAEDRREDMEEGRREIGAGCGVKLKDGDRRFMV